MAEFPLPVLQIWRSRKRVAIQIQLMNIFMCQNENIIVYVWSPNLAICVIVKIGDCTQLRIRMQVGRFPWGYAINRFRQYWKVDLLQRCCLLSFSWSCVAPSLHPPRLIFDRPWAARGIEIVWGQWLVPPVRRIRRCIGYFLVILLIDVKILLHHAQREARPQDICSCEDALVFTPVWQAISRDVACV